jgi:hypothetical protein
MSKFKLLKDHKVRLSDQVLKAGVYTLEELEEAHKHDSLEFCLNYTTLKEKLVPFEEVEQVEQKTNKKK